MKKLGLLVSVILVLTVLLAGCAQAFDPSSLVGRWQSERDKQVIEFTADGTYKGVKQTGYKYEVIDGKQLKIVNPEVKDGSDSIVMDFKIKDDVLTTTVDGTSIEWKRAK